MIKVRLPEETKKIITVAEMPMVRKIMQNFKKSDEDLTEYAAMAARVAGRSNGVKIVECSAEIAKNCRVYDLFENGSGMLDIWIEFTAFIDSCINSIIIGGAYLSDIWQIGSREANEVVREHMYIREFVEKK